MTQNHNLKGQKVVCHVKFSTVESGLKKWALVDDEQGKKTGLGQTSA